MKVALWLAVMWLEDRFKRLRCLFGHGPETYDEMTPRWPGWAVVETRCRRCSKVLAKREVSATPGLKSERK